jgi:methyl-accepting chemotaxis protein
MVVDTDLNLIFMNRNSTDTLKGVEPQLRQVFGNSFRAEDLMGRCIDDFHANPQHQRRLLANESIFPYKAQIAIGPLSLELNVTSVKGANGETVGFCAEWQDVTARLKEEQDYKDNVKVIADRMAFLKDNCVADMANAMDALVNGDLTVEITPKTPLLDIPSQADLATMASTFNELRNQTVKSVESYNSARESLCALIAQVRGAADTITTAAQEVAAGTDDLSQRTEEQSSNLEETASSMEEMTATVKQNADNARQANQLATQAREVAEKGGAVVSNAVSSMEEISSASKRIADIISVIDEIAFQTNLLALNAAVEAARVGEQGRGFAVVAAEVRNLAGRSATAAKEIKSLVQDSVQKVGEGSNLVNQSGKTLDEIVTSVKKVADIISEISAASQEQSAGIEQVNKAVMQMDTITQQNAALVEETAAASQAMASQAGDLQGVVSQFTLSQVIMDQIRMKAAETALERRSPKKQPFNTTPSSRTSRFSVSGSGEEFEEF